ncbi:hypothetical protein BDP27DRAFT_1310997 [Rhodocollybia butyracea]|uniref:CFEM domain-containing protein n=1 Tax=Rhodocollybia butyracea TaxID=206335 RepID=A0A9P5QBD5_9AGAR|nr:hypothetical protein BDP27DRAFT_1310997 [Rhodocollybia butyracea]
MASYSRFSLLATLALTATLGRAQNVTLPLCAQTCATTAADLAGCTGVNDTPSCLCNSVDFATDASSCIILDCTPAEQDQASTYFTQYADINCGGTTLSGTSGLSPTSLPSFTFTTPSFTFSTPSFTFSTPTAHPTIAAGDGSSSGSGSGIKGFTSGSLGGFVTASDMLKIATAAVVVGATVMQF